MFPDAKRDKLMTSNTSTPERFYRDTQEYTSPNKINFDPFHRRDHVPMPFRDTPKVHWSPDEQRHHHSERYFSRFPKEVENCHGEERVRRDEVSNYREGHDYDRPRLSKDYRHDSSESYYPVNSADYNFPNHGESYAYDKHVLKPQHFNQHDSYEPQPMKSPPYSAVRQRFTPYDNHSHREFVSYSHQKSLCSPNRRYGFW